MSNVKALSIDGLLSPVGITQVQGFTPTQFYLSPNEILVSIRPQLDSQDPHRGLVEIISILMFGRGAPVVLKIKKLNNVSYLQLSPWIETYSEEILTESLSNV